uniref:Capsid protein n=1 Tax=Riboviria sp. TaxID=2585031 RepID=A0A514D9B9_9VIRU|nr:MAG: hypothetical protein H1Bulk3086_000003 [Riboviria sp.]
MPRDCTEAPGRATCTVPSLVSGIQYMTKRKTVKNKSKSNQALTNKMKQLAVSQSRARQPKSTPFASAGKILGSSIGGLFGGSGIGGNIGKFLGSGIGSIFGSGDYTVLGPQPSYNMLANSSQIPKFSTTERTNIICHREYLGDITGTAGFSNIGYPLNPGIAQTFPWLSSIAENFQEYRFHGLVFEFRPLITDFVTSGAPGVIVMATQYNADVPIYPTKQAMENSEYAVSVKPTLNLMHAVECAVPATTLPQRYVRTGAVPSNQDLRFSDYGIFQLATQANPVQNLGELWVSYCVEFFKPELPATVGGNIASGHAFNKGSTSASPFGVTAISNVGTLALTITPTTISFFAQPSARYLINVYWFGAAAACTLGAISTVGGNLIRLWNNDSDQQPQGPNTGTSSTSFMFSGCFFTTITTPGNVTFVLNGSGTYPVSSNIDMFVTELDASVTI